MDSLVDAYLEFKAINVEKYVKAVLKHYNSRFRLTNKLVDIVYDYLNEVYLSEDYLSNTTLTQITGLKLDRDRNSLLALFVDFGVVTRMALKNKDTSKMYLFIVDTILFFIRIECLANTSKFGCDSFEGASSKVFKRHDFDNEIELKDIINGYSNEFINIYDNSLKKNNKFNSTIRDNAFDISYTKLDDTLYIANFVYGNEALVNYDEKEVEFVKEKYTLDMFHYNLQLLLIDFIEELLMGEKKKIIISVPNEIVLRKSFLKILLDETHIFSIKKNIVLAINYSTTEKDENIIDSLYDKGYDVAVIKDMTMPKNFDLASAKYLLLDYFNDNEFRNIHKVCSEHVSLIIKNELSKFEKLECLGMGIKYFVKK